MGSFSREVFECSKVFRVPCKLTTQSTEAFTPGHVLHQVHELIMSEVAANKGRPLRTIDMRPDI